MLLIGKPSISMGHLYHGYVSHNQRVSRIVSSPTIINQQGFWTLPTCSEKEVVMNATARLWAMKRRQRWSARIVYNMFKRPPKKSQIHPPSPVIHTHTPIFAWLLSSFRNLVQTMVFPRLLNGAAIPTWPFPSPPKHQDVKAICLIGKNRSQSPTLTRKHDTKSSASRWKHLETLSHPKTPGNFKHQIKCVPTPRTRGYHKIGNFDGEKQDTLQ